MAKKYAVLVAGGSGSRMNAPLPKQFMKMGKQPILMHTITTFYQYDHKLQIILVIPATSYHLWTSTCMQYDFDVHHRVVTGGSTRFHSVQNGLNSIAEDDGLVAIHDGVRPLVSTDLIERSFAEAEEKGSAVAAVPLKESIRRLKGKSSKPENREDFMMIQTPQTFRVKDIRKAYQIDFQPELTDDASVADKAGIKVNLIDGEYQNMKITTEEDLFVAEALMSLNQQKQVKTL